VEQVNECGGKNLLTCVLLHVIEPSQPINFSVNRVANLRHPTLDYMQHAFVSRVDAINHAGFAKRSGIGRLSAARRIKRCAVKCDRDLAVIALAETDNLRIKFEQARIVIIESLSCCHD